MTSKNAAIDVEIAEERQFDTLFRGSTTFRFMGRNEHGKRMRLLLKNN